MTERKFNEMTNEEAFEWAYENIDDITHEDILITFAKRKIDDENLYLAIHILEAIYNNTHDTDLYLYDYSMGTLDVPTPVTDKEDFKHLIDFDDEEE